MKFEPAPAVEATTKPPVGPITWIAIEPIVEFVHRNWIFWFAAVVSNR